VKLRRNSAANKIQNQIRCKNARKILDSKQRNEMMRLNDLKMSMDKRLLMDLELKNKHDAAKKIQNRVRNVYFYMHIYREICTYIYM
jgi:hypothetical protein